MGTSYLKKLNPILKILFPLLHRRCVIVSFSFNLGHFIFFSASLSNASIRVKGNFCYASEYSSAGQLVLKGFSLSVRPAGHFFHPRLAVLVMWGWLAGKHSSLHSITDHHKLLTTACIWREDHRDGRLALALGTLHIDFLPLMYFLQDRCDSLWFRHNASVSRDTRLAGHMHLWVVAVQIMAAVCAVRALGTLEALPLMVVLDVGIEWLAKLVPRTTVFAYIARTIFHWYRRDLSIDQGRAEVVCALSVAKLPRFIFHW